MFFRINFFQSFLFISLGLFRLYRGVLSEKMVLHYNLCLTLSTLPSESQTFSSPVIDSLFTAMQ
jgi:hypothetical protein